MIIDKSMREQVYKDLVQLKGLFTDVAKNGASSTYMITSADQKQSMIYTASLINLFRLL